MKMKNIEVVGLLNALNSLSDVKLPVRLSYGIKKNHKKLLDEYSDYEDQLNALRDKYNGDEKSDGYGKELRELLDIDVEIEFYKISDEIFESSDFNITPQQLSIIDFMIDGGDE